MLDLCAAGWTYREITQAARVGISVIKALKLGQSTSVSIPIGRSILAVPVGPRPNPRFAAPLASRRRLHALASIGYSYDRIGEFLGVRGESVSQWALQRHRLRLDTVRLIEKAYAEFADKPNPAGWRTICRTKNRIEPWQWEDKNLDDPNETPWPAHDPDDVDEIRVERLLAEQIDPDQLTDAEIVQVTWAMLKSGLPRIQIYRRIGKRISDPQLRKMAAQLQEDAS